MHLDQEITTDDEKRLKVKLPVSLHVRLHTLKILTGKTISDTVTEALEAYFQEAKASADGPQPSDQGEPSEDA